VRIIPREVKIGRVDDASGGEGSGDSGEHDTLMANSMNEVINAI